MRVKFYGLAQSLQSWKKLVEQTTKKACTPVIAEKDKLSRFYSRHSFVAFIDEKDCELMMKHWYEVEEGQDLRWNCRVTFTKSSK